MFTQCSKCETVYRLSAEVLRAASGQVRCGAVRRGIQRVGAAGRNRQRIPCRRVGLRYGNASRQYSAFHRRRAPSRNRGAPRQGDRPPRDHRTGGRAVGERSLVRVHRAPGRSGSRIHRDLAERTQIAHRGSWCTRSDRRCRRRPHATGGRSKNRRRVRCQTHPRHLCKAGCRYDRASWRRRSNRRLQRAPLGGSKRNAPRSRRAERDARRQRRALDSNQCKCDTTRRRCCSKRHRRSTRRRYHHQRRHTAHRRHTEHGFPNRRRHTIRRRIGHGHHKRCRHAAPRHTEHGSGNRRRHTAGRRTDHGHHNQYRDTIRRRIERGHHKRRNGTAARCPQIRCHRRSCGWRHIRSRCQYRHRTDAARQRRSRHSSGERILTTTRVGASQSTCRSRSVGGRT